MKRTFLFLILLLSGLPNVVSAPNNATAALDRNAEEERYRILSAQINNILETQELLRKQHDELKRDYEALAREVQKLKEEEARGNLRFATREDLTKIVDKMKEIEKHREADKKLILDSLQNHLAKVAAPASVERTPKQPAPEPSGEFYSYTVQSGDTLLAIVGAYNAEFEKKGQARISVAQVEKANPDLKPNKLLAGQTIRIPVPPEKKKK